MVFQFYLWIRRRERKGIKEDIWRNVCKDSILSGNRISSMEPMSVNYFPVWTNATNVLDQFPLHHYLRHPPRHRGHFAKSFSIMSRANIRYLHTVILSSINPSFDALSFEFLFSNFHPVRACTTTATEIRFIHPFLLTGGRIGFYMI